MREVSREVIADNIVVTFLITVESWKVFGFV